MTPSKYIKSQGLPSTAYVAAKVGKPVQTINNWYHNNFALFEVVVAGVNRAYEPPKVKSYNVGIARIWDSIDKNMNKDVLKRIKPGALIYFRGSMGNAIDSYQDKDMCALNCNPIVADVYGKFVDCWVAEKNYDVIMETSDGNPIQTIMRRR